jgi:CHASE2 domain-containing sensor protein
MNQLVTIKISGDSSDLGYHVSLQIAEECQLTDNQISLKTQVETTGKLPPASALLQDYRQWQDSYRNLDLNPRLEADPIQITNISVISTCQDAAQKSLDSFNHWLNAESFHQIREQLARNVKSSDRVRFILQIDDPQLHRLPWQLGDLFKYYHSTEVVLSSSHFERVEHSNQNISKFNILAILGNSQGINIEADRQILAKLPNAKVEFLVEPSRQEINDRLWEQQWDILFFAGHSSSSKDNTTGQIYINQTDSLSLNDLRFGLKKAIANGLKIAIFNSCDGLGLAKSLSDLQIPQVIVMREPVPDCVAQSFLTEFLTLYSQGNSFYQSVREAREKLQGLEDKYPCATWLPTVYQQGTKYPPTWKQLERNFNVKKHHVKAALLASLGTTLAIAVTRFVGILQPLELNAFDLTMRSRPSEPTPDENILVIEVTRKDRENRNQSIGNSGSSLSDENLNHLLNKLIAAEPRIIGIDNYLSHPIDPKYTSINNSLKEGELVAVCKTKGASKTGDRNEEEIAPPQGAIEVGLADTVNDDDSIARRHLISIDPKMIKTGASCNSPWALSWKLAYHYLYLEEQKIELKIENDEIWIDNFKKHPIPRTANTGGYQKFGDNLDGQYKILLNYRLFHNSIREGIKSLPLSEALKLSSDKFKEVVRDKLILIGTTDPSYGDIVTTPYGKISGVFHQAQMTSQLISAALTNRPLFWASPFWIDGSIILLCSTTGALLAWGISNRWLLVSLSGSIIVILCGGSVVLLTIFGYWFPLIPTLLGLVITSSCVNIYLNRETKLQIIESKD